MTANERQAKVKKLDAILSKISNGNGSHSICPQTQGMAQSESFEMIPQDQIKVEVLDSDDEIETYVRPTRLIPRTGLESFSTNTGYQSNQQNTVFILNNGPSYIEEWNQLQMEMFNDCVPVQVGSENSGKGGMVSEDGDVLRFLTMDGSNSVEARRTVLDAYLYQDIDHNNADTTFSSHDYGIPPKDTFVVVHPSESLGNICSICKKTYGTKKSLKRHLKEVHKTNYVNNHVNNQLKDRATLVSKNIPKNSVVNANMVINRNHSMQESLRHVSAKQTKNTNGKEKNPKSDNKIKSKKEKNRNEVGNVKNEAKLENSLKGKAKKEKNELLIEDKKMINDRSKQCKGQKNPIKTKSSGVKQVKPSQNARIVTGKTALSSKVKDSKRTSAPPVKKAKTGKAGKEQGQDEKTNFDERFKLKFETNRKDITSELNTKKAGKSESNVNKASSALNKAKEIKPMPFQCPECGEGFKSATAMERHAQIHSMLKYHCYRCNDVFMNMRSLTKHLVIHENEPVIDDHVHRCRVCSQSFKTSRQLRGHLLEHEKLEKQEGTSDKGKKTREIHNFSSVAASKNRNDEDPLLQNNKVPTNERVGAVTCKACNLEFDGYSNFKDHVIEKHINLGDTSLQCDKCGEILPSQTMVVSHLVKRHRLTSRKARAVVRQKETDAIYLGINASIQESPVKKNEKNASKFRSVGKTNPTSNNANDIRSGADDAAIVNACLEGELMPIKKEKSDTIVSIDYSCEDRASEQMDFEVESRSPKDDKSCVLEEQESMRILQALFIEVDGEILETSHQEQLFEKTHNKTDYKLAEMTSKGECSAAEQNQIRSKKERQIVTSVETNAIHDGKSIAPDKANEIQSKQVQSGKNSPSVNLNSNHKVEQITEPIIDLSGVAIDEDDDEEIDWFWKNDENEVVAENIPTSRPIDKQVMGNGKCAVKETPNRSGCLEDVRKMTFDHDASEKTVVQSNDEHVEDKNRDDLITIHLSPSSTKQQTLAATGIDLENQQNPAKIDLDPSAANCNLNIHSQFDVKDCSSRKESLCSNNLKERSPLQKCEDSNYIEGENEKNSPEEGKVEPQKLYGRHRDDTVMTNTINRDNMTITFNGDEPNCKNSLSINDHRATNENLVLPTKTLGPSPLFELRALGDDKASLMHQNGREKLTWEERVKSREALKDDKVKHDATGKETCPLASMIYVRRRAAIIGEEKIHTSKRGRSVGDSAGGGIFKKQRRNSCETEEPLEFNLNNIFNEEGTEKLENKRTAKFTKVKSKKQVLKISNSKDITQNCADKVLPSMDMDLPNGQDSIKCSHCNKKMPRRTLGGPEEFACKSCSKLKSKPSKKKKNSCTLNPQGIEINNTNETDNFIDNASKANNFVETCGVERNRPENIEIGTDSMDKKFTCITCGKFFNTTYFLSLHQKRHENLKTQKARKNVLNQCSICKSFLSTKQELAKHRKEHSTRKGAKGRPMQTVSKTGMRVSGKSHTGKRQKLKVTKAKKKKT